MKSCSVEAYAEPLADNRAVAVFLSCYQAENHLAELLRSIAEQTHRDWTLWVSDEGSTDATWSLLRDFESDHRPGKVRLDTGLATGYLGNYTAFLQDPSVQAAYYAIAEQDTVWDPCRLERAVQTLSQAQDEALAVYAAQCGEGAGRVNRTGFPHALVENALNMPTLAFNHRAREFLAQYPPLSVGTADRWAYVLISALGGEIYCEPHQTVRDCKGNPWRAGNVRQSLSHIDSYYWGILLQLLDSMPAQNQMVFRHFMRLEQKGLWGRLRAARLSGVHHRSWWKQAQWWLSVIKRQAVSCS